MLRAQRFGSPRQAYRFLQPVARRRGQYSSYLSQFSGLNRTYICTTSWRQIMTLPKRRPFAFQLWFNVLCTCSGDVCVQMLEGNGVVDVRRAAVFACQGFSGGFIGWFWYVSVYARFIPEAARFANSPWAAKLKDKRGQVGVVKQVLGDIVIYSPIYYFPMFYCLKTVLQNESGYDIASVLPAALSRYSETIFADNMANVCIFTPITVVAMIVPVYLRLPVMIVGNFIFALILSYLRGCESSPKSQQPSVPDEVRQTFQSRLYALMPEASLLQSMTDHLSAAWVANSWQMQTELHKLAEDVLAHDDA